MLEIGIKYIEFIAQLVENAMKSSLEGGIVSYIETLIYAIGFLVCCAIGFLVALLIFFIIVYWPHIVVGIFSYYYEKYLDKKNNLTNIKEDLDLEDLNNIHELIHYNNHDDYEILYNVYTSISELEKEHFNGQNELKAILEKQLELPSEHVYVKKDYKNELVNCLEKYNIEETIEELIKQYEKVSTKNKSVCDKATIILCTLYVISLLPYFVSILAQKIY